MGQEPGADLRRRRLEERILQLEEDFTSQGIVDTRWAYYEQLGMALPAACMLSLAGTCTLTNSSTRAHTHRQLNLVCPGDSIRSRHNLPIPQGKYTTGPFQVI